MLFKKSKSRRSEENRFRRVFLEQLEDRRLLTGTISGHVFHDLNHDAQWQGQRLETFDSNPGWGGDSNRSDGYDYGFSNTDVTGGQSDAGEAGGKFVRSSQASYYADTNLASPLTLGQTLFASGELALANVSLNGSVNIGYLNTESSDQLQLNLLESAEPGDHIRAVIQLTTSDGEIYTSLPIVLRDVEDGPREWSMQYSRNAENDASTIVLTISGEGTISNNGVGGTTALETVREVSGSGNTVTVTIPAAIVNENALFDAFGLSAPGLNSPNHSLSIDVFVDNLSYTTGYEVGVAGITMYIDGNDNGKLDLGEPTTVSVADDATTVAIDEAGQYRFENVAAGTHIIRTTAAADGYGLTTAPIEFATATKYSAGQTHGVKSADFDGDGDIDLVNVNLGQSTTQVRFNDGTGVFDNVVTYNTGSRTLSNNVADLDGDGDIDIIVSLESAHAIKILQNNGSGSFDVMTTQDVGNAPRGIDVGDVDGDGDVDIVVANQSSNSVSIVSNNGSMSFSTASLGVGAMPVYVALGDIDNDGDLDLAVAHQNSDDVRIYKNDGTGSFAYFRTMVPTGAPNAIDFADFDLDGDIDLVTTSPEGNHVRVWPNPGDGTFAGSDVYAAGTFTDGVAVGDLNADGYPDIATANRHSGNATVLLNNGDGTFTSQNLVAGNNPIYVTIDDFNGDGVSDLAVGIGGESKLAVLSNKGIGFSVTVAIEENATVSSLGLLLSNQDPTLGALSDVTIAEDTAEQTVNLTGITAGGGESQPLRCYGNK